MEFQSVRSKHGHLIMTLKQWIEQVDAIGMALQAGRYGGTCKAIPKGKRKIIVWIKKSLKIN